jgi:hypothetical protein
MPLGARQDQKAKRPRRSVAVWLLWVVVVMLSTYFFCVVSLQSMPLGARQDQKTKRPRRSVVVRLLWVVGRWCCSLVTSRLDVFLSYPWL